MNYNIKDINELRRNIIDELIKEKTKVEDIIINKVNLDSTNNLEIIKSVLCNSEEEILNNKDNRIYTDRIDLYKKYIDLDIHYNIPLNELEVTNLMEEKCVLSEIMDLNNINKNVSGSYHLNVTNSYTVYYLYKLGYKSICLSIELNDKEIELITNKVKVPLEIVNYPIEVMTIKSNILNIEKDKIYKLVSNKNEFEVSFDGKLTHIIYK